MGVAEKGIAMKKSSVSKLKLDKQTVRYLAEHELGALNGGISSESNYNTCRGACGGSIAFGCGESKAFVCTD
jgi:hypothetical protein